MTDGKREAYKYLCVVLEQGEIGRYTFTVGFRDAGRPKAQGNKVEALVRDEREKVR